ncbi:hypothetical protein J3R82DRAFT_2746 [Butyriboletus roseoflavus]|nr:hypothetical protein J3R82DRAFT_2746 [Butyriboletus roseoflavus]
MVDGVARAEVIGYEQVERSSSELTSISLQHTGTQSPGEHAPVVDAISHCSESSTSPAPTVTLNGSAGPISTLLEELLVMIFDDVITSESSSCQCRRKRAGWWLSSPRSLASVSRAWRTVVFACPMLWRHVHLTPVQSIHALKEHLHLSSPFPIHLTVHQWPFRSPTPASGLFSIVALTAQLQSILSPANEEGTTIAPASERVESIHINATESSTFLNFVLQT